MKGIELQAYGQKDGHISIGGVVDWIQIDNQDPGAQNPVVLAPTPTLHHKPTLLVSLSLATLEKKQLYHVDYCGVLLQELDVNIEKTNVLNLVRFVSAQMDRHDERGWQETGKRSQRSDSLGKDSETSERLRGEASRSERGGKFPLARHPLCQCSLSLPSAPPSRPTPSRSLYPLLYRHQVENVHREADP